MSWNDPYLACLFKLELGTQIGEANFLECTGLKIDTGVVPYEEGGENSFVHQFHGPQKFSNIVLRHGVAKPSVDLWRWKDSAYNRKKPFMLDGAVILLDEEGKELVRWLFHNGFPVKWDGPELKGGESAIAVETLEIAVETLTPLWPGEEKPKPPEPDPNPKPEPNDIKAEFDFTPEEPETEKDVSLKDKSKGSPKIDTWEWSCPAIKWTSSEQNPSVQFKEGGTYLIKLKVTNSKGKSDATTHEVKVKGQETVKAEFSFNSAVVKDGKLDKFKFIPFKVDKYEIDDLTSEAVSLLDEAVKVFEDNPALRVELNGYASKEGNHDHNVMLAQGRANTVRQYMKNAGIGADQITNAKGNGPTDQFAKGDAEASLKQNRRVEWVMQPAADGKATKLKIRVGDDVLFTDESKATGGKITKWEWSCEKSGWTGSSQNPKTSFKDPGSFPVKLTVTTGGGKSDSIEHPVEVEDRHKPGEKKEDPVEDTSIKAKFSPDKTQVKKGEKVKLTDQSESKSKINKWEWSCPTNDNWKSNEQHPTLEVKKVGAHNVTLKVTNAAGKSDQASQEIKGECDLPDWPALRFTYEQDSNPNYANRYVFKIPDAGPNGEKLAFIDWDFGQQLEAMNTRFVHQKKAPQVSFPKKGDGYTIVCGIRLQGHEDCWYTCSMDIVAGTAKKGKSGAFKKEPYKAPQGSLKKK